MKSRISRRFPLKTSAMLTSLAPGVICGEHPFATTIPSKRAQGKHLFDKLLDTNICSWFTHIEQVFVGITEQGVRAMAIAPLPQQEELALFEMPWPKPVLRVASTPALEVDGMAEGAADGPWASISELFPSGSEQAQSARHRAATYRRRRLVLLAVVVGVVLSLALPLKSLGAVTTSGVATPSGTPAGLGEGTPYVVQAGDTLASIARAINPSANQGQLINQMRAEVGSSVVVPGEHLILP